MRMRVLQVLQTLLLLLLLLPTFSSRWITAAAAAFALWFFTIPDWHLPTCEWQEKKIERESHKRWRGLHGKKIANSESGEWRTAAVNQVPISAPPPPPLTLTLAAVTRHICTCIHKHIFFCVFCTVLLLWILYIPSSWQKWRRRRKKGKNRETRITQDAKGWKMMIFFYAAKFTLFLLFTYTCCFLFFCSGVFFNLQHIFFFEWCNIFTAVAC